ncbi:MAG: hypothetical protein JWL88_349 [Parcubacteria group bacterium]|nr:hypothetical protein [Parcubacteria group bacterium]
MSQYILTRAGFDSVGFRIHQRMVADSYLRKGFINAQASENLLDIHDRAVTAYALLSPLTRPDKIVGTFRILSGREGLPLLTLFPHLAINGIRNRLCESSRVVSVQTGSSGQMLQEVTIQCVAYASAKSLLGVVSLGNPRIFERINGNFSGMQRGLATPCMHNGGIVIPSIVWVEEFESWISESDGILRSRYSDAKEGWAAY